MSNPKLVPSIDLYLDWINNFLSLGGFCEYYDVSEEVGSSLIARSKILYWQASEKNRNHFTINWSENLNPWRRRAYHRRLLNESGL